MPITLTDTEAIFTDTSDIEEAEVLLDWLKENPEGLINLKACSHIHTAIFQVLLALKPNYNHPPEDPFLKEKI
ncbi:hypothetical protein ACQZV8_20625, partial [Magnetococcales bacterium HHB-1]